MNLNELYMRCKSLLQVALHERIHTGVIKHECPYCDYRVQRYITLTVHIVSSNVDWY